MLKYFYVRILQIFVISVFTIRAQYYKAFYSCNLQMFIITVAPARHFQPSLIFADTACGNERSFA
jgi:hypothetical protein